MKDFNIILDSLDTTSWIGSNIYDATYYINLNQLLDYNFDFTKNYKVSFSFKGSRSLPLIGNVIGVHLNNISNSLQTQTNLLGLLNVKYLGYLNAEVITNEEDNPSVYLKNLNNSSVLTVKIETLIYQSTNMRSYFTTDLLNWYRFRLVDVTGTNLKNYGFNPLLTTTLGGGAEILENEIISFTTVPSFISLPSLDLTPYAVDGITISVWIRTTQTTQFTLFVLTGASIFQFRIIPSSKNRCLLQYGGILTIDYTEDENNDSFKLNDGRWKLITVVLGNDIEHKLYINGLLVKTGVNAITNLTGIKTNFLFGMNTASVNNFFGEAYDFRLYEKEVAATKIRDYYYNNPVSENPDYKMNLHFQEV